MTQQDIFGKALWLGTEDYPAPTVEPEKGGACHFPILRCDFDLPADQAVTEAELRVVGLGYFHCYINGKRVSDDLFMPIYSDFEPRNDYPTGEVLTGHRIYIPKYDVAHMLRGGRNCIVIHCGGGWYTHGYRPNEVYGDAKAIFRLTVNGDTEICSSTENTRVLAESFIKGYHFARYEHRDYTDFDEEIYSPDFDASSLPLASAVRPLSDETVYGYTDCPTDRVIRRLTPKKTAERDGVRYYDAGENISGYPVFEINAPKGEKVRVVFSEEINADGTLNDGFTQRQEFSVISDGKKRVIRPLFLWFGFRCFSVEGDAEPVAVEVIHSNVAVTSDFETDNQTLNWLYKAFINTQLSNMHSGIPSDCPHIERRGYTGDGQLICHSAMLTLDAEAFYRKWLRDISDCQDILSGHVQYTAPYARCGGGPGGWGCAIVEVPYRYYLHHGDTEVLRRFYPQMLRYFDYLESHSENDLVLRDQEGLWCLGDWATPASVVMPAPYVNNYFYIKSLEKVIEIARLIGREEDTPAFKETVSRRKKAIMNCYFNSWDGSFLGNLQGANAFAVDIGLGDGRTYPNMVDHYRKTGCYDTGIFGTELVTRMLFEHGDGDVAVDLLTSEKEIHTFDGMRQRGATTLWEYFPGSLRDRSHSHPMFGAVVACFYEYLLGIKGNAGYRSVTLSPVFNHKLNRVRGSVTLNGGKLSVSYERSDDGLSVSARVTVPKDTDVVFEYGEMRRVLCEGENEFEVNI